MPTESDLINKISRILKSPLEDRDYDALVSPGNELSDSITEQLGPNADWKHVFYHSRDNTREGFVLRSLGHVSANPSLPEKREMLSRVYVYSREDSKGDSPYPNYNRESSMSFLEELIRASKREKDIYEQKIRAPRDVYIITDHRGVGKTFFINHLFTTNNDYTENNDVIWIRIDVPDNFGGLEPNLAYWLQAKITFVILRYCYGRLKRLDGLLEAIERYIETKYTGEEKLAYVENFTKLKEMYIDKKLQEALSPRTIKEGIARELTDQVIKSGYSFIFVLDGFDRVDITPYYNQRYTNAIQSLQVLIDLHTRLGGCYLLVMRTETISALSSMNNNFSSNKHKNFYIKNLAPVEFNRIVERRISYLEETVPALAELNQWSDWDDLDWPDHLHNYQAYFNSISEQTQFPETIALMNNLFGDNHRAKMHTLQLLYHDYLRYARSPKRYKLIEAMLKAGFAYPPKIYIYYVDNGKLTRDSQYRLFDSLFFPLIYQFPYAPGYPFSEPLPVARTYILLGLRLVQVIQALKMKNKNARISAHKVIRLLNLLFGYERVIVSNLLEEFSEYGLVRLLGSTLKLPDNCENCQIEALPKLNSLYDSTRQGILHDVAYLNMCAMRILVAKDVLTGKYPFVKALSLDQDNVAVWARQKIINTISIYRLIRKSHQLEESALEARKRELPEDDLDIFNYDPLVHHHLELEKSVMIQVERIIKEMDEKRRRDLDSALNRYADKWCKPGVSGR